MLLFLLNLIISFSAFVIFPDNIFLKISLKQKRVLFFLSSILFFLYVFSNKYASFKNSIILSFVKIISFFKLSIFSSLIISDVTSLMHMSIIVSGIVFETEDGFSLGLIKKLVNNIFDLINNSNIILNRNKNFSSKYICINFSSKVII